MAQSKSQSHLQSQSEVKITTRGRYAVIAMIELAKGGDDKPIPLSEIAEHANISLSYLEQLIAGLRRQSLVKSYRGPGGGYILAKPMSEIMVADILIAAEDSTPAKRKTNAEAKETMCEYSSHLWGGVGKLLRNVLNQISLKDILDRKAVFPS